MRGKLRLRAPMPLPDPTTAATVPFRPTARRQLTVFGAPAELVLLPGRIERQHRAGAGRPPFAACRGDRIVAEETLWRGDGLCATPNRFPFAADQLLLWRDRPGREVDAALLAALFACVDRIGGTGLLNGIGAAASIARAHAHLTSERLPFLAGLPERAARPAAPVPPGVQMVEKQLPFLLLGLRGGIEARAAAAAELLQGRLVAACNLVAEPGAAWLFPRSPVETPAPHFPHALGAAEVWGRWCFVDERAFAAASSEALERALCVAGCS